MALKLSKIYQLKKTVIKDFQKFLKEYKIISLAIAFVIGAASNSLVKSLVENIIMPLIDPLLGQVSWKEAVLNIGPFSMKYGAFLGDLLHFTIIAFVIFIIVKKIMKLEKPSK